MDGEDMVKLRLAHPFRPFTIVTTKGRRLEINKPYHIAVAPDRNQILCELPDGGFVTFKPTSIATVEMHDAIVNEQRSRGETGGSGTVAQ